MVVLEAYAVGLPVLASAIGSLAEVVEDGQTGRLHRANDAEAMREQLGRLADARETRRIGENARVAYLERYSPERNYSELISIYHAALDRRRLRGNRAGWRRDN